MKCIPLAALALVLWAGQALAQNAPPGPYQCVRPDGTVICSVNNPPGGDPSVICNYECVDCNMVCTAKQVVTRQDGKVEVNPGAPPQAKDRRLPNGAVETPESCRQDYQSCVARCRSSKTNVSRYDMDACISSCNDTLSGCGMKP